MGSLTDETTFIHPYPRRLVMKIVFTSAAVLSLLLITATGYGQATGDYRSNGTGGGNWTATSTWQTYNGSAWVAASAAPTGSEFITVQGTDSVYIDAATSITGTLRNQNLLGGTDNLTIADGGTYQHDLDEGSIPVATWETGSTLLLTGTVATAPDNRNQSFYNVTFDTPGLLSNLNMAWDSITIGGDINVVNTSSARWYMTSASAGDSSLVTIMGDVIVSNGNFSVNGTGNANTRFVVHHYGNIVVTGGNLSVSRGSQGSGTGSTRWYIHEGNFTMQNATTQNSNPTNAWFVFDKAGTQTMTLGAGNTLTALPVEVMSGTTLDMGQSELRGSGLFVLNAGATLATAHEGGMDSTLSVTGNVTLDSAANFTFNGNVAQVTGMSMPTTVNDLVINNSAGVALSQPTTINGVLRLVAGVFDNTIPFTLGPSGSISFEGGSLLIPTSVDEENTIPTEFFVRQNYPNPFNPTTTIRFGLPASAHVTITVYNLLGQEVARILEGRRDAGTYEVPFEASRLGSGVYLYRVQADRAVSVKRMILLK
jgi:hypothetical protein